MPQIKDIIDEQKIFDILKNTREPENEKVLGILNKALDKKDLSLEEVGYLINSENPALVEKMFELPIK